MLRYNNQPVDSSFKKFSVLASISFDKIVLVLVFTMFFKKLFIFGQ